MFGQYLLKVRRCLYRQLFAFMMLLYMVRCLMSCCGNFFLVLINICFTRVVQGILLLNVFHVMRMLNALQFEAKILLLLLLTLFLMVMDQVLCLVFGGSSLTKLFYQMVHFWNQVVSQFVKLFIVLAHEFFTLRIKLIINSMFARYFVSKGVHVVSQYLFQILESSKNLRLNFF